MKNTTFLHNSPENEHGYWLRSALFTFQEDVECKKKESISMRITSVAQLKRAFHSAQSVLVEAYRAATNTHRHTGGLMSQSMGAHTRLHHDAIPSTSRSESGKLSAIFGDGAERRNPISSNSRLEGIVLAFSFACRPPNDVERRPICVVWIQFRRFCKRLRIASRFVSHLPSAVS